jgi:hypothetical protein
MNRCLALLFALLFASVSVASACTAAAPTDWVRFKLEPARDGGGAIEASFRDENRPNHENNWSTAFPPSQLVGLDVSGFRSVGTRPLRFAVMREAGRLDCSGEGGNSRAAGNCSFTIDPGFAQLLESRGIGRPSREQAFGLVALNVRRDLIDAVAAAHYPTPTIGQLMEMTAVGVTGDYITGLAHVAYRPQTIHSLVEFRALNITPDYVGGFVRMGYGNMAPNDLVQLKALDISPEFVAGFERLGYGRLPADTLVQLKALDITPEFVRASGVQPGSKVPVGELMHMKIFGRRR